MKQVPYKRCCTIILLIMGCQHSPGPEQLDDLNRDFYLTNVTEKRTTSFKADEDVFFNYVFIIDIDDTLKPGTNIFGLLVNIEILQNKETVGSISFGRVIMEKASASILAAEDTISIRASWLSNENNDTLLPGSYTSVAEFEIFFNGKSRYGSDELDFSVSE